MGNKVNYIRRINFINLFYTRDKNETQKIKHNP